MDNQTVKPIENIEYAGFWVRLGATLIDTIILCAIIYPLLFAFYGSDAVNSGGAVGPMYFWLMYVMPAVAVIIFWSAKQATPGKMVFKLKVVDATTGAPPSIGQCIGRYFAYFLSAIVLMLGYIWVAFDRKKQAWHDKLAGTVVVRLKSAGVDPVNFEAQ